MRGDPGREAWGHERRHGDMEEGTVCAGVLGGQVLRHLLSWERQVL